MKNSKFKIPKPVSKRMNRTEYTGTVNPTRVTYSSMADPKSAGYRSGYIVKNNPDAMIYKMRADGYDI